MLQGPFKTWAQGKQNNTVQNYKHGSVNERDYREENFLANYSWPGKCSFYTWVMPEIFLGA
jgi:hypothetical protein